MILGIAGSPRKGMNNDKAIEMVMRVAGERGFETNMFSLAEKKVLPCTACDACKNKYVCVQKDDMNELYSLMEKANAIVVSSPVYFGGMSAQLKAVFDRTRPMRRHGSKLKNKIGAAIATAQSRNGGQENTIQQIHAAMHINSMIIVGDGSHFGGATMVPIENDEIGLKSIADTAKNVCDVLEMIK